MALRRKPVPASSQLSVPQLEATPLRCLTTTKSMPSLRTVAPSQDYNYTSCDDCQGSQPLQVDDHKDFRSHHPPETEEKLPDLSAPWAQARSGPLGARQEMLPNSAASDDVAVFTIRSKVATAMEDTSIFLGGLIKHPTESNRHISILRHSPGLVFYRGPSTSLTISVFSDKPLPPGRRIWLQMKGWTGNTGMAAKALFRSNSDWVDVTPTQKVEVEHLSALDERAWQRDIKKFWSKATKPQLKHVLRQTIMVRIPYEASDGYFRLVLTAGISKTVLCPSPVFRIASASITASSIKGASLATLPLELGVKVAQTTAMAAATKIVAPWAGAVTNRVVSVAPIVKYGGHAKKAWDLSGMRENIDEASEQYQTRLTNLRARPKIDRTHSEPAMMHSHIVGADDGPEPPFPVLLKGVAAGSLGHTADLLGMVAVNLSGVPPDAMSLLPVGVYFGWALLLPRGDAPAVIPWQHGLISVQHAEGAGVAQRKCVRTHLVQYTPPDGSLGGAKLKLIIMGYLRSLTPSDERDVLLLETVNDIAITQASLSRPAWSHDEVLQRVKTAQGERNLTDRMVDLGLAGQRHVDRVPVHMLGVRSDTYGAHDRAMYGNGGCWIKRD